MQSQPVTHPPEFFSGATPLPWAPLFHLLRSGNLEISVYGTLVAVEGSGKTVLSVGDTDALLWSRSLLKPWQLMSVAPALAEAYPHLSMAQWALMMASQNGEDIHQSLLQSLHHLGEAQGLSQHNLQCPACYPMSGPVSAQLKVAGEPSSPGYHPCAGKHWSVLLAAAAQNLPTERYLEPEHPVYQPLYRLMGYLTGAPAEALPTTIDGCGMPNLGFPAKTMAELFRQLAQGKPANYGNVPPELQPVLERFGFIRDVMSQRPGIIGGSKRLDTRLMADLMAEVAPDIPEEYQPFHLLAKEGADGLLGIGISATPAYPDGLGILVKLSSGYDAGYLERVALAALDYLKVFPNGLPLGWQGETSAPVQVVYPWGGVES